MKNVNQLARKNQLLILFALLFFVVTGGTLAWVLSAERTAEDVPPADEPAPDMTGVINATFNDKIQTNAIAEAQRVSKEMSERFNSLQDRHYG